MFDHQSFPRRRSTASTTMRGWSKPSGGSASTGSQRALELFCPQHGRVDEREVRDRWDPAARVALRIAIGLQLLEVDGPDPGLLCELALGGLLGPLRRAHEASGEDPCTRKRRLDPLHQQHVKAPGQWGEHNGNRVHACRGRKAGRIDGCHAGGGTGVCTWWHRVRLWRRARLHVDGEREYRHGGTVPRRLPRDLRGCRRAGTWPRRSAIDAGDRLPRLDRAGPRRAHHRYREHPDRAAASSSTPCRKECRTSATNQGRSWRSASMPAGASPLRICSPNFET